MHLTKKIQVYLSAEALEKLWSTSSACTRVFNAGLEQRRDKKSYGKVNIYSQKKELRILKKEFPEFKKPSSQVLQNSLFSLDRAYKMFFTKHKNGDKEVRPPKFRSSKYFFTQEYSQKKISFDLSIPGQLRLAYGSSSKDWIIIEVPHAGYEGVKTVKITRDKTSKKWFACMTYEIKEHALKTDGHVLYFDRAVKHRLQALRRRVSFLSMILTPFVKSIIRPID